MYRNHEGYPDPTVGGALKSIAQKEHLSRKPLSSPKGKYYPKIYVCSPFAGDIETNIANARRYCAFAVKQGYIPYASHLFFPQFLSDDDPERRELGLFMGMVFLDGCRECWVFGSRISSGMAAEIDRAKKRGLAIRYYTEQCEEVSG